MDTAELVALEEAEARIARELGAAVSEEDRAHLGLDVLEVGGATLMLLARYAVVTEFNRTVGLGLRRPVTDDDLTAIRAAAHERGVPQVMLGVNPAAQPADLEARLLDLGATPVRAWMQMGRSTEAPPEAPAGVGLREVGPDESEAFMDVMARGFGMPDDLLALGRGSFRRPGWHHYLASLDGEVVGCGSLGLFGDFGWLGNATTLPGFRQRGVQAALIARRIRDAGAAGAGQVFSQVAEELPDKPNPSEHNMRRAGFTAVYRRPNYLLPTA